MFAQIHTMHYESDVFWATSKLFMDKAQRLINLCDKILGPRGALFDTYRS